MRHIYQGHFKDGNGRVITNGTIYTYLSGTTTAANVYIASSGGSSVNSVTSDSITGYFKFYVDTSDYVITQRFKITLSKTSYALQSYDDIAIFPFVPLRKDTTANRPTLSSNDIGYMYMDTTLDADGKPIWWNGTKWIDATGGDA